MIKVEGILNFVCQAVWKTFLYNKTLVLSTQEIIVTKTSLQNVVVVCTYYERNVFKLKQ